MVDRLSIMGAEAIEAPMIRIAPPEDPDPLLRAADDANHFDWIVFTSANSVEAFMSALLDGTRDVRWLKEAPLVQCRHRHGGATRPLRRQSRPDP